MFVDVTLGWIVPGLAASGFWSLIASAVLPDEGSLLMSLIESLNMQHAVWHIVLFEKFHPAQLVFL